MSTSLCLLYDMLKLSFFQGVEDFRTALQRAHKYFVELDLLSRSRSHQSAFAAGSSSNDVTASESFEIDRHRVEIMNRIVEIQQRNLRVRYELKLSDVLKSYVACLFFPPFWSAYCSILE